MITLGNPFGLSLNLCAHSRLILSLGLLWAGSAVAAQNTEPPAMEDFAVGRWLYASESGGLQSVLLDFEVYEWSIEPGLADLRVFDAEGQPVPYAIRRRRPRSASRTVLAEQALPLFALEGRSTPQTAGQSATRSGPDDAYEIHAEVSDSGAILRVLPAGGAGETIVRPASWLLDASSLDRAAVGVFFDFDTDEDTVDFVTPIRIETSDDLAGWRSIEANVVVARLAQDGHLIQRFRFEFPATRSKYFRFTPESQAQLPHLREIRLRPKALDHAPALATESKIIPGSIDAESPRTVLFDLLGAPAVTSVRLLLPSAGSLIEGQIESASNPEGPWKSRGKELSYFYERDGAPFRNPKREWRENRHRYIRFITSNRGGGLLGEVPALEIEWVPDQLLYLDRGTGPSTLAIGKLNAQDASFTPDQLLATLREDGKKLREATARLGEERILAGPDAYSPAPLPIPWRTYALWGLLVGVVGIVLGLGLRLARDNGADSPERD